jgi:predicted DNA-binding ribbon-helix-helix protein
MKIGPSSIIKHSVVIHGRKTSVSLEPEFWNLLKMVAKGRKMGIGDLLDQIDGERTGTNLSSWIRLFVLDHVMRRVALQKAQTEETIKRR